MAGRLQQIGSAFVRLFVKKDELDRGLNEAKAQVGQATQEMNQKAATAGAGFNRVADGLKSATKPARNLLEAVTGALSIFTRILGIVSLISAGIGAVVAGWKAIAEYAERAEKASQAQIDKQRNLAGEISKLAEEDKNAALAKLQAEYDATELLRRQREINKEIADLRGRVGQTLEGTGNLIRLQNLEKEKKSVDELIRQYLAFLELINRKDEERIRKRIEREKAALREVRNAQLQAIESIRGSLGQDSLVVSIQNLEKAIRLISESHYLNAYRI